MENSVENEEWKENLWNQVSRALDSNDEDRVISLAKKLSDLGDWRGSNTLGYVFQVRADRVSEETRRQGRKNYVDKENFIASAHWYMRGLSQGGGYASHKGLASYYYYGLGGKCDFELAYEHLNHFVAQVSPNMLDQDPELIQHVAKAKIMMAELLFLGLGAAKDLDAARKLFSAAAAVGYPAAIIGLSRIEKAEKHFARAIFYYFRALRAAIKLVNENKDHPLLAGTGGRRRTFRPDWVRDSVA
jgi:hypothetical protein